MPGVWFCGKCGFKYAPNDTSDPPRNCPRCNPKNTGLDELDMLRMIAILARQMINLNPDYFKEGRPEKLKWAVEDYEGAFRK